MAARHGKIARLPLEIREQLNARINNGEPAANLVPWLNAQPAVQAVLASLFDGIPISEQNVSNWRQGGFLEWAGLEDWRSICGFRAEDADRIAATGFGAQTVLVLLMARIAAVLDHYDESRPSHFPEIIALQRLVATVNRVRQTEQRDERLALDRERLELDRETRRARRTAEPSGQCKVESGKPETERAVPSAPKPEPAVQPPAPSTKPSTPPIPKPSVQSASQPTPAPGVPFTPPSLESVARPAVAIPIQRFHPLIPVSSHRPVPTLQAA